MKPAWPQQLKALRGAISLSQDGLARALDVTKKTVAEWEQARQAPNAERALQLARLAPPGEHRRWFIQFALERIGADPPMVLDALLGGPPPGKNKASRRSQGPLPVPDLKIVTNAGAVERVQALHDNRNYVPVPVLSDAAAAGHPREINEADVDGYALIQYGWCPDPADFTCLRVHGDSMNPILHDGALVAIDHSQRDPLRLHQKMVAARTPDGGVTIKWLERTVGGPLRLVAENKSYDPVVLPVTEENPILGMVSWWWNRPA